MDDLQALFADAEIPVNPPKVVTEANAAELLLELLSPKVADGTTLLRYGATARAEGYDSEADYLASQRRTQVLRLGTERHSHRRWMSPAGLVVEILENSDRSWRGRAACRRQQARANAARFWYGVPHIILGS